MSNENLEEMAKDSANSYYSPLLSIKWKILNRYEKECWLDFARKMQKLGYVKRREDETKSKNSCGAKADAGD